MFPDDRARAPPPYLVSSDAPLRSSAIESPPAPTLADVHLALTILKLPRLLIIFGLKL